MQVSIYLREELVRKVDRLARKARRSRSKMVEALLESALGADGGTHWVDGLTGAWKDSRSTEQIIADIYRSRRSRRGAGASL